MGQAVKDNDKATREQKVAYIWELFGANEKTLTKLGPNHYTKVKYIFDDISKAIQ